MKPRKRYFRQRRLHVVDPKVKGPAAEVGGEVAGLLDVEARGEAGAVHLAALFFGVSPRERLCAHEEAGVLPAHPAVRAGDSGI